MQGLSIVERGASRFAASVAVSLPVRCEPHVRVGLTARSDTAADASEDAADA